MRFAFSSAAVIGIFAQLSLQSPAGTPTTHSAATTSTYVPYTPSPSGYVRVVDSPKKHEIGYYLYVDPRNGDGVGAPAQFTPKKSEALYWDLVYSLDFGGAVYGYKPDNLILSSKSERGSEVNDTVVMNVPSVDRDVSWVVTDRPDQNGDFTSEDFYFTNSPNYGVVRNITQLCHTKNAGLANPWNPVFVLASKLYPDCSPVTLNYKVA